MDTGLEGRTAIVTGAAQGIGEAIARALHAEGANVVLVDLNGARVQELAAALDSSGRIALGIAADVSVRAEFRAAFEQALARHGRVEVLVNNAACLPMRPLWELDDAEWDAVLAINLRSAFIGCQLLGEHMRANGFGRIINLSSIAGQEGATVLGAHYAASKAGIISLTQSVARVLAADGVTVNAVAPGAIHTPLFDTVPDEQLKAFAATVPVKRLGTCDEVASLVVYLASTGAGYITGATLDVNGGSLMR
jgi:3-oxoacyl-[acyl-carrier protein] reductase